MPPEIYCPDWRLRRIPGTPAGNEILQGLDIVLQPVEYTLAFLVLQSFSNILKQKQKARIFL